MPNAVDDYSAGWARRLLMIRYDDDYIDGGAAQKGRGKLRRPSTMTHYVAGPQTTSEKWPRRQKADHDGVAAGDNEERERGNRTFNGRTHNGGDGILTNSATFKVAARVTRTHYSSPTILGQSRAP